MSRIGKILWFIVALWAVICLSVIAVTLSSMLPQSGLSKKSELGLVTIEGEITTADQVLEEIQTLRKDDEVKGIVLRVESPGGAVAASQEIYQALEQMRADSFPVVASFGNIAASGGFYAALPAEHIFADPGSLTGSIGVITQFMHGEKLMDKIGIEAVTITSGALKDAGSPMRAPRAQDVAYFQGVVDDTYQQFLESVSKWRKIPIDSLRPIADGRVFTGRQAKALRLIDSLGGQQDAVKWLTKRCKLDAVPDKLETAEPPKPFLRDLMDGLGAVVPAGLRNKVHVLWMTP